MNNADTADSYTHRVRAFAAIAFLPCALAHAQTPPDEALTTVQVTAQRIESPIARVAPWVSVVEQDAMRAAAPQVPAEALRGTPGAFFQQTAPGQGMAIVRGLKGAEVLHLVDGMRLNNAFFRTAPSQYVALVDPQSVDRIELVRGPAATLYGSDAMGGVVHMITAEPQFASSDWQMRGTASASYASGDVGRQGRLTTVIGRTGLSWSLGASRSEFGTRDVTGSGQSANGAGVIALTDRVAPSSYETRGFDTKILWAPTARSEWLFSAQSFEAPNLPRYNEVVPGFGTAAAGQADAAISQYDNARRFAHVRYRARFETGRIRLVELHAARQTVIDDRFDRSLDLTTDAAERNRSTLDGFTAMAHAVLSPAWSLTFGTDAYRDSIRSSRADTRAGVTVVNGPASSVKSRFPDGATSDSLGLYTNAAFAPASAWRFDAALRADHVSVDLPVADRLSGGRFEETALSGGAGASWAFTPTWSWHTNLRHGFRAPNVNDLAQIGRRTNNRIVIANTALGAESLWSLDTGLRGAGSSWSAEAALFYARYRDRITLVDTGVVYANGVNGCSRAAGCLEAQSRNIARASYYGFEGGWRWQGAQLGLAATLNYTFGEQESAGVTTPANRVPPLNGMLSMSWRASDSVDAELRGWFAGRQDRLDPSDLRDNRIDPTGTPGYTSLDAAVAWRPNESLVLRLSGRNLLDRDYREHGSGIDATGRSVVVSAQYRFGAL